MYTQNDHIPLVTPKNISKTACSILIKSACFCTAVGAAAAALAYFLQKPVGPIVYSAEELKALEQKIGNGTGEECRTALSNYPLSNTGLGKIIDAVGGPEEFCNLPTDAPSKVIRGMAPDSSSLVLILSSSQTTEVIQHPESKVVFKSDENHEDIYFQLENSWVLASCDTPNQCQAQNLDDRDIEDLGRLIHGESICKSIQFNEWISTQVCKKLV